MRSASPVRRVTVRAEKQRNMKMGFAAADLKRNFDDGIKSLEVMRVMIGCGVERETVNPGAKRFALGQQLFAAALGVSLGRGKHAPFAGEFSSFEAHRNFLGGRSLCGIQTRALKCGS